MILERIESEGLARYSYLLGLDGDAAVIDPRRDVDVYLDLLADNGLRLRHVFETHRNEDYLTGSCALARHTGAAVWRADPELPYEYGLPAEPGGRWALGSAGIEALPTPGHTPGHISYLVRTQEGTRSG